MNLESNESNILRRVFLKQMKALLESEEPQINFECIVNIIYFNFLLMSKTKSIEEAKETIEEIIRSATNEALGLNGEEKDIGKPIENVDDVIRYMIKKLLKHEYLRYFKDDFYYTLEKTREKYRDFHHMLAKAKTLKQTLNTARYVISTLKRCGVFNYYKKILYKMLLKYKVNVLVRQNGNTVKVKVKMANTSVIPLNLEVYIDTKTLDSKFEIMESYNNPYSIELEPNEYKEIEILKLKPREKNFRYPLKQVSIKASSEIVGLVDGIKEQLESYSLITVGYPSNLFIIVKQKQRTLNYNFIIYDEDYPTLRFSSFKVDLDNIGLILDNTKRMLDAFHRTKTFVLEDEAADTEAFEDASSIITKQIFPREAVDLISGFDGYVNLVYSPNIEQGNDVVNKVIWEALSFDNLKKRYIALEYPFSRFFIDEGFSFNYGEMYQPSRKISDLLVIADSLGDLKESREEAKKIMEIARGLFKNVNVLVGPEQISFPSVASELNKKPSIIHFTTHFAVTEEGMGIPICTEYNEELNYCPKEKRELMTPKFLSKNIYDAALIYMNTCQSFDLERGYRKMAELIKFLWNNKSIINFIGTLSIVFADESAEFAKWLYNDLVVLNKPIGEAVLNARRKLHDRGDAWFSFSLFGNPRIKYA